MLTSLAFAAILATPVASIVTPYAKKESLEIREIKASAPEVPLFEVVQLRVDLGATYDNPFDPDDVTLDARVVPPSGIGYTIPGFIDRQFSRRETDDGEALEPVAPPFWTVRIAPKEVGEHHVTLTLKDRTGTVKKEFSFQSTSGDAPGFIRVSPRDRRYFEFTNGKAYYPVGANVGWGTKGTYDYERWFSEYGRVGANYSRVWLSPAWTTFGMEQAGKASEGKGLGQFDLANAWRLDQTLEIAKQNGLYLMLCLDSYNVLRDRDGFNYWEKSPHNRDNGGPLRLWNDFWSDPAMEKFTKMKHRYLVGRYGAFRNVFAWELWNEVDLTRDFETEPVRQWHQRAATSLRDLDPYDRPITTSLSNTMGIRELELIQELDFFQTHHYGSADLAGTVATQQARKAWGRPHLVSELGADASGPRDSEDPTGIQIHDPIWASISMGVSGTAAPWWWDNYIHPKGLYPIFGAAAKFTQDIDWPGEDFHIQRPKFFFGGTGDRPRKDLVIPGVAPVWTDSPLFRPKTITFSNGQVSGTNGIAGIQHGIGPNAKWHNPILFKVTLDRPTRFEIEVGDVSGYGGAILRVELDGERVLTREFADPDGVSDTTTISKYAGRYGFTVPKGYHTIRVENVGVDWFMAGYRFKELLPRTTPPIEGWGIVGNETVLVWARAEGRTWKNLVVLKDVPKAAPASIMRMSGMASGIWTAELWDTWKGVVKEHRRVQVGLDGILKLTLPPIAEDVAIKLRRNP